MKCVLLALLLIYNRYMYICMKIRLGTTLPKRHIQCGEGREEREKGMKMGRRRLEYGVSILKLITLAGFQS